MQQKTGTAKVAPFCKRVLCCLDLQSRYERKVTREQFKLQWWVTSHLFTHSPINIALNIFRYKYNVREMHSLSEYPSRTCLTHQMWSKLTLKTKGGEKYHVHYTERTRNVTFGADNLTFKVGALGDFRKKKILITSTGNSTTVSRVFRLWVNHNGN